MSPRLFLLILLPACSVGPLFKKPSPDLPADFASRADSLKIDTLPSAWWRKLNDPTLNRLIEQTATANKDLAVGQSRLQEARALWREARFDYAPTVTSAASYQNFRNGATAFGAAFQGRDFELIRAGLDATWELDFFGRVRSSVKAARATSDVFQADLDAQRVALAAQNEIVISRTRVASAWIATHKALGGAP